MSVCECDNFEKYLHNSVFVKQSVIFLHTNFFKDCGARAFGLFITPVFGQAFSPNMNCSLVLWLETCQNSNFIFRSQATAKRTSDHFQQVRKFLCKEMKIRGLTVFVGFFKFIFLVIGAKPLGLAEKKRYSTLNKEDKQVSADIKMNLACQISQKFEFVVFQETTFSL